MKKKISVVTPCYNEADNVAELFRRVRKIFDRLDDRYEHDHIFIDNHSTDGTVDVLRELAKKHKNLKVVVNSRNYGHIRSPFHGFIQADGDAAILIVADLQEPPEMIETFLQEWESGEKMVLGRKTSSEEQYWFFLLRKAYYVVLNRISDLDLFINFTGFGLYDKQVVDAIKGIDDRYPYFRGIIADIGFSPKFLEFRQPNRRRGISKNNWYTLYDMAMLGLTSYSKIPLRFATMCGFFGSLLSLCVALFYLGYKILHWQSFALGNAPVVVGLFLGFSVMMFFIGILGEYIGSIHTQVLNRPLVVEKERINF